MSEAYSDNVLDQSVYKGLDFIRAHIKRRVPVPLLAIAPTRKKKIDSQGNFLRKLTPTQAECSYFGKALPGTVQEQEVVEKASKHPLGFAYGMRVFGGSN